MKLTFSHRATSRIHVTHVGELQLRDNVLRSYDGEDPRTVATFDGEWWVTPDGRVWTHIDIDCPLQSA